MLVPLGCHSELVIDIFDVCLELLQKVIQLGFDGSLLLFLLGLVFVLLSDKLFDHSLYRIAVWQRVDLVVINDVVDVAIWHAVFIFVFMRFIVLLS